MPVSGIQCFYCPLLHTQLRGQRSATKQPWRVSILLKDTLTGWILAFIRPWTKDLHIFLHSSLPVLPVAITRGSLNITSSTFLSLDHHAYIHGSTQYAIDNDRIKLFKSRHRISNFIMATIQCMISAETGSEEIHQTLLCLWWRHWGINMKSRKV